MGNRGDIVGSTQRYSVDQKSVSEQASIEFHKPIVITKEMVDSYKKGKTKAENFFAKRELNGRFNLKNDLIELIPGLMEKNPKLEGVHPDLIKVYNVSTKILAPAKMLVVTGPRSKKDQELAVKKGNSQTLDSKHNRMPSMAIDVAPLYKGAIPWKDHKQFSHMSGISKAVCEILYNMGEITHKCRRGDDWSMDGMVGRNTTLYDPGHWELLEKKVSLTEVDLLLWVLNTWHSELFPKTKQALAMQTPKNHPVLDI